MKPKEKVEYLLLSTLSTKRISEISGVDESAVHHLRYHREDINKISKENELNLSAAYEKIADEKYKKVPPMIDKIELSGGGFSYSTHVSVKHKTIYIGTFPTLRQAIIAQNNAKWDYRESIKLVEPAPEIEITPELEAKVKSEKGLSFYKIRGKIIGIRVEIMMHGNKKYLGKFRTIKEAVEAKNNYLKKGEY